MIRRCHDAKRHVTLVWLLCSSHTHSRTLLRACSLIAYIYRPFVLSLSLRPAVFLLRCRSSPLSFVSLFLAFGFLLHHASSLSFALIGFALLCFAPWLRSPWLRSPLGFTPLVWGITLHSPLRMRPAQSILCLCAVLFLERGTVAGQKKSSGCSNYDEHVHNAHSRSECHSHLAKMSLAGI